MRIIVISDTHGNLSAIESVFLRNEDADWFFHLGDGERELDDFLMRHPEFIERVIHVAGNCDPGSLSPGYFILPIGLDRIFATHGHLYGVKQDLERLKAIAKQNECNIVLYGHTHVQYNKFEDGLYILNPGSGSAPREGNIPTFGHVDILEFGVVTNIAEVKPPKRM